MSQDLPSSICPYTISQAGQDFFNASFLSPGTNVMNQQKCDIFSVQHTLDSGIFSDKKYFTYLLKCNHDKTVQNNPPGYVNPFTYIHLSDIPKETYVLDTAYSGHNQSANCTYSNDSKSKTLKIAFNNTERDPWDKN